jgi:hypothetical protein
MDVDRTEARMMKPGKETGVGNISIKQMWEVATKLGAKPDSVARIQYNEDRCEFSITGTGIDIRWDGQGKLQSQWLDDDEKKKLGIED